MELIKLTFLFGGCCLLLLSIPGLSMVNAGRKGGGNTGGNCVSSCKGLADNDYQSCHGCYVYATCSNGILHDNRPCPANLVWDDNKKRCEGTSSTCYSSNQNNCKHRCFGKCMDDKLCDGKCDCRGCSDETLCKMSFYDRACGPGYMAVKTGSFVSFCSIWNKKCPGPNSMCVLFWGFFGICCKPNVLKPKPCCEKGELHFDLRGKGIKRTGILPGVSVIKEKAIGFKKCAHRILLQANFERIDNKSCFGCLDTLFCGRRVMRVDLELGGVRGGYMFNGGDSESNNGFAGDAHDQENDAEVQVKDSDIDVYLSDKCNSIRIGQMVNAAAAPVSLLTMYFSNQHVLITNDNGDSFQECNDCLFAVNGQSDTGQNGGPNEDMFFAINRVIQNVNRVGFGVCQATFKWACPCDDIWPKHSPNGP